MQCPSLPPGVQPVLLVGAGWGCPPLHVPRCAKFKPVEAGASGASGGLPVVSQASRERNQAQRAVGPQGRGLPRSGEQAFPGRGGMGLVGSESQRQAQAPGSSFAGNWGPSKAAGQLWGTKDAPEWMELPRFPKGRQRMVSVSKSLGLRTALLNAQANPRAQVWAPGERVQAREGLKRPGEQVPSLGSPREGFTQVG